MWLLEPCAICAHEIFLLSTSAIVRPPVRSTGPLERPSGFRTCAYLRAYDHFDQIHVYWSVRKAEELQAWDSFLQEQGIKYTATVTQDPTWTGCKKRITHIIKAGEIVPNLEPSEHKIMICGNLDFNKEVATMFDGWGFKEGTNKEAGTFVQEKAFVALCQVNKWILRKDILRFAGKTINGIKITESGILAAAHLAGAGNVKKYLRSNGSVRFSDAYGSSIKSYLNKFAGYDVSIIRADRKASV